MEQLPTWPQVVNMLLGAIVWRGVATLVKAVETRERMLNDITRRLDRIETHLKLNGA